MASFVGLDLSSNQARILEAEGTAKKLKIKNFASVDLVASEATGPAAAFMDKETAEQIGKAFSKNKFSREPIAMSWDSDHTIFREMTLPFLGEEQIRKVIKYEAESHLLNCDIDDVVVSFYKLREEKEKARDLEGSDDGGEAARISEEVQHVAAQSKTMMETGKLKD